MDKKEIFIRYIRSIKKHKKLTLFIKNLFEYEILNDNNYIFRIQEEKDRVIIDIYDNISINRFNRYIFIFDNSTNTKYKIIEENNVFVTYLPIYRINVTDSSNKIIKLAYLFSISESNMIEYASSFLDDEFVDILKYIIKK